MKKFVVVLVMLAGISRAYAQDEIETDRPTEGQSAQPLSKGSAQLEIGFGREQQDDKEYSLQHPDLLLRIGVLNKLEFRLQTGFETEHMQSSLHGVKPLELGIKANVFQAKDTSFTATLYSHLGIPELASKAFKPEHAFYRYAFFLKTS